LGLERGVLQTREDRARQNPGAVGTDRAPQGETS
jgi:hypothetical protein